MRNDGIYLTEYENHELVIALISLNIGFQSYYSTYQSVKGYLEVIEDLPSEDFFDFEEQKRFREKIQIDYYKKSKTNYIKGYIETILHFQHFIEMSIKEILRQEHELLVSIASRNHVIFHKLLKGDEVSDSEIEKLNTLNFSESTDRLRKLIKEKRIKNHENMGFINENNFLGRINDYRNRLLHRGRFVLDYADLDKFIGKDAFPFILKLLKLPIYKRNKFQWQYKPLHCQINPIEEIIKESLLSKPNYKKIALLKEMGRAAYKNPLSPKRKSEKTRIEEDAKRYFLNSPNDIVDILMCPVCGANTLHRYSGLQENEEELTTLNCICCSFEIKSELKKVNIDGLDIKTLWKWD